MQRCSASGQESESQHDPLPNNLARNPDRTFRCRSRFWILGEDETFLGYGRVLLLERIREHGSITRAAASMEMSYRHAWELVASMNSQAMRPLVVSTAGGRNGGGASLTPEGERMIRVYRCLFTRHQEFIDDLQPDMEGMLAQDAPPEEGGQA